MNLRFLGWPLVLACIWILSGCGTVRTVTSRAIGTTAGVLSLGGRKEPEQPERRAPKPVEMAIGEVHFVHPKGGFVLVKSGLTLKMSETSRLEGRSLGQKTSDLILSPERRSGFLVADVVTGRPEVGDKVFYVEDAPVLDAADPLLRDEAPVGEDRLVPTVPLR